MSHLLNLPTDILVHELFPFLVITDLCRFDEAVTNHLRPQLFLAYSALSLKHSKNGFSYHQLIWFLKRKISVNSITFSSGVDAEELNLMLRTLHRRPTVSRVTELNLSYCASPSPRDYDMILHFNNLESVSLSCCSHSITKLMLTQLGKHCPCLSSLDLSHTHVSTVAVIAVAKKCSSLTSLNLSRCVNIRDDALVALAQFCPTLCNLSLKHCPHITYGGVISVLHNCLALTTLNLRNCDGVSGAGYLPRGDSPQSSLTALNLCDCQSISAAAVHSLVSECPLLCTLDLSGCDLITDQAVVALSLKCPVLKCIQLGFCPDVGSSSVGALAKNCPELNCLRVNGTAVTDRAVVAVAEHCRSLTCLDLSFCHRLTDSALLALAASACCASLTALDVECCRGVSGAAVSTLVASCPRLTVLDLSCLDKTGDCPMLPAHSHPLPTSDTKASPESTIDDLPR